MANRLRKTKPSPDAASRPAGDSQDYLTRFISWSFASGAWVAFLLAMVAFLVYRPSLTSDFVYDARKEILDEGYITSLSNLPAVLSFKVLNANLMLGSRPGQLLYLMLNAALWGKDPFGYHLVGNFLHAVNAALLFLLLVRLAQTEIENRAGNVALKIQIAAAAATLIFALHPLAVESVSEVSYSSSLLVAFFTLTALHAAIRFRPKPIWTAILMGSMGVFCAFAAVTAKESGIAAALVLVVYFLLFRRSEAKGPWLLFLGAAMAATAAFLAARFMFPPPPNPFPLYYLGGSFLHVFWIQPCLWVFMMGKLLWPLSLSADYTLENMSVITEPFALVILTVVILLQGWLAMKSRVGALGVALYWLGLVAVSNFVPLLHPVADRYYYLPLAGVALQLFALLLLTLNGGSRFWLALLPFVVMIPPLIFLTLSRQDIFASNMRLWQNTIQASPFSETAHYGLGLALLDNGQTEEAVVEFKKALKLNPHDSEAHNNLGIALFQKGQVTDALEQFRNAVEISPGNSQAHYNLGLVLVQNAQLDAAIAEFEETLRLKPDDVDAQDHLDRARAAKRSSP